MIANQLIQSLFLVVCMYGRMKLLSFAADFGIHALPVTYFHVLVLLVISKSILDIYNIAFFMLVAIKMNVIDAYIFVYDLRSPLHKPTLNLPFSPIIITY